MKVGIVTIIDNNNYGNRLQNYAIQKILNNVNVDAITLKNEPYSNTKKNYLLRIIKNIKFKDTYSKDEKRKNNFKSFNKYIKFSEKRYTAFSKYNDFDYVIVGSDQVWNPNNNRMRDVDLLANVPPEKRISFAASFGISNLEERQVKKVRKEVKKFKGISVREEEGKKILNEVCPKKNIEVLMDPTMALDLNEWNKIMKKPNELSENKRYILKYFLGGVSSINDKKINKFAQDNNCEIVDILDKKSKYYNCGPREFIYLEKNAYLICTDSFHSSVFAILYNKPFFIFDREGNGINMNSRLNTLINKFNLQDRKVKDDFTEENMKIDYKNINRIIEQEKQKTYNFLNKYLYNKE